VSALCPPPALVGTITPAAAPPPAASVAALLREDRSRHADLARAIYRMRFAGASWGDVGRALGITREGARKRWRWLDDVTGDVAVVLVDGQVVYRCTVTGTEAAAIDLTPAGRLTAATRVRAIAAGGGRCAA
jgi:hypothetical protein